jgi:histidyl-tRNA synthetase
MGRTISRALQDANREAISHAIIIGPKEIENKEVTLREMKRREQHTIKIRNLLKEINATATEE